MILSRPVRTADHLERQARAVSRCLHRSATSILHGPPGPTSVFGRAGNRVEKISFEFPLPASVDEAHYSLTAPGLVIEEGTVSGSSTVTMEVVRDDLYDAGFTQIILGADTL